MVADIKLEGRGRNLDEEARGTYGYILQRDKKRQVRLPHVCACVYILGNALLEYSLLALRPQLRLASRACFPPKQD